MLSTLPKRLTYNYHANYTPFVQHSQNDGHNHNSNNKNNNGAWILGGYEDNETLFKERN